MMQSEIEKSGLEKTAFAHKRDAYIMSSAVGRAATESCFHAIRLDFDGEKRAAAAKASSAWAKDEIRSSLE